MKRILSALTLSAVLASPATAEVIDSRGKALAANETVIHIRDFASGGCWTNIGEVKTYAKDKLELKNYRITDTQENRRPLTSYTYSVQVTGWRPYKTGNAAQVCMGNIRTTMWTVTDINGVRHMAVFGTTEETNFYTDKMNRDVLNQVSSLIAELPRNDP